MTLADEIDPDNSLWDWLAFEVRRWRTVHGISQSLLARRAKTHRQTVNNVESGQRPPTEELCDAMDELYGSQGFFRRLLMFARLAHNRDWFRQFVDYEKRAYLIKIYEHSLIPGLLQTEDYARACLRAGRFKDLEAEVIKRMKRQSILSRPDAPRLQVLLSQSVLYHWVGGPEVMKAQLARLLELSKHPDYIIRIAPWRAGAHPGMDGAFRLARVAEGEIAFTEAPGGGRLVEEPAEVLDFSVWYDCIGAVALSEDASRRLIERVMESFDDPSDLA
ncbi:helix-turn-helix domain-containing protein [Actinomadura atramentaria]|uniref:helix-turn-helix domain-containing protein n=1 Tax=Actinomadura atramentaria TaxID=1990 RepID=UPI000375AD6E|nr:helix-turn-helix transcriptional regulator [Actinomadura atramentaria]